MYLVMLKEKEAIVYISITEVHAGRCLIRTLTLAIWMGYLNITYNEHLLIHC